MFLFRFCKNKKYEKKIFVTLIIFVVVLGTYIQTRTVEGAVYIFTQNDWSGGQTVNVAGHSSNQVGWSEFNTKDSNLIAGSDLRLNNVTNTANFNFNTESHYSQQNASSGTDFSSGKVTLHKTDLVASGGNQTYTYGSYVVKVFKSSGTFTVTSPGKIDYLIVGGGGSGGAGDNNDGGGGGGGAGGVVFKTGQSIGNGSYSVVVGSGGATSTGQGNKGGNSAFRGYTAIGGGGGGYADSAGHAGGSGGGGSRYYNVGGSAQQPGSASGGYGYAGGRAYNARAAAGGGGGAGGSGKTPTNISWGGAGGNGRNYSSYFGTGVGESGYFASGGGGGGNDAANRTGSSPLGGGGGGGTSWSGPAGQAYTGGGGGGGDGDSGSQVSGGAGGKGVVIVRYLSAPIYPTSWYYVTSNSNSRINTSSWGAIEDVRFTQSVPANTKTRYLVSFDGKTTWKYWTGSTWATSSLANISTSSMTATMMGDLNASQWNQVFVPGTFDVAVGLSTTSSGVTPSVDNIAIDYTVPQTQTLVSNAYNTETVTAALSQITWSENLGSNTDIKFQLRTSADGSVWSPWCGPDDGVNDSCNSSTYFTDPLGAEVIDDTQKDHVDDQYFQYKADFSTDDGQNNPILSDVFVSYDDKTFATVSTGAVSDITALTATGNGNIVSTGDEDPERFVEWGVESGVYTDQCSAGIGGSGDYFCTISGIEPGETYYYRAKAINSVGTTYGDEMSFSTLGDVIIVDPEIADIDQAVSENRITVDDGSVSDTNQTTARVNVIMKKNKNDVFFPRGTIITEQNNQNFNFQNFTLEEVGVKNQQRDSRVAMRLGVPGEKLNFSQDITMTVYVGHAYNDEIMDILYQEEGESTWNPHTTCVVSEGSCTFQTDHATIYTINGQLQSEGDTPININTEVQDTLTLDCFDTASGTGDHTVTLGTVADPGKVTAGTPATGQSTCTVTTNDDQGYYLTIIDDNAAANTVLTHTDPHTGSIYEISDLTQYAFNTPNTINWNAPTTKGLGFSVVTFPDTDLSNNQLNGTWTQTNQCPEGNNPDTNDYAGIPDTAETIAAVTQYESNYTTTNICYKVDVPASQASGQYTGSVTYTATSDASSYLN